MAHILCVTDGMTSVVYSVLELARRLSADGHDVTFAGASERRELVERLGLEFCQLETRELALELGDLAPDLVLVDGEMHEHIVVSIGSGLRTALLNTFCSIWRRPGLPPPHTLVRPGVGWRGSRVGIWLYWTVLRWRKRLRTARLRWRHRGNDRISQLHRLARQHGFDLRAEADAGQWLIPFTYRNLPTLSLHALEFDFPHEPPEHVRYVGPMVLRDRGDESPDETARLDAVLRQNAEQGRKLIFAGFGSTFTARSDLVQRLAAAAKGMPWDLVVSLGRNKPSDLVELPENVYAFRWLPQLRVLERADIAIVHGGINTIDECVLHGVPMLAYCGFETDMAGNTARVIHHGLGVAGGPADGPEEIRGHVERLLTESSFRDAVGHFRRQYQAYERARVAERAVAELLDNQEGGT